MATMRERPDLSGGDFTNSRRLYHGAIPFVMGKSVLDFGCGLGHGSYFLHPYTLKITGFDIDPDVVKQANDLFQSPTLTYTSDLESIKSVDTVISVEAIEHLEKEDLVEKIKYFSTVAPSIYCTTPNGNFMPYRPKTKAERRGFHIWHYTEEELRAIFCQFYSCVHIYGVLRDDNPQVNQFVGYSLFATNQVTTPAKFLFDYKARMER